MKRLIVFLSILLASCLVLVVVAVAANWSTVRQFASFSPIILPNFGPAPANEAEARSKDIDHLGQLLDYDRSFDETARKQFEELVGDQSFSGAGTLAVV